MSDIGNIPATSEITPERVYLQCREFIKSSLLCAATSTGVGSTLLWLMRGLRAKDRDKTTTAAATGASGDDTALTVARHFDYAPGEKNTFFNAVTNYNNFYEFGTDKSDPAANAYTLKPRTWHVAIDGEVAHPQVFEVDQLIKSFPLEERIYRMRCVEAWSMVIPWVGFRLGDLLKRVEPTSRAKYVAFKSLLDPQQMPGQRTDLLQWPYVEGLRIDEAMHPLTILAVGLYGKRLPTRTGHPSALWFPGNTVSKGSNRSRVLV